MEFNNLTPFPSLAFEAIDQHGREFHVIAIRATFDITPDSEMKLADEQQPLAIRDEYFGEVNKSSIRLESDLSPYKPKCDVIVIGSAYSPGGKPVSCFEAGIRISGAVRLDKRLTITGQRFWEKSAFGWTLSEPEPIASLPLQYEYSYGGECCINQDDPAAKQVDSRYHLTPEQSKDHPDGPEKAPVAHTACELNPIGMGYTKSWYTEALKLERIPAPQIESPADPILEFKKSYAPQGLGVITKSWGPRLRLAGTYDERWLEEKWPILPNNFDFAYWNGAHPDMQVPTLKGDEIFELSNLTLQGTLKFQLPELLIFMMADYEHGEEALIPVRIDTVIIEPDFMKASLVWRAVLPVNTELMSLEAWMILKKDKIEQEKFLGKMSLLDYNKFKPGEQND